MNTGLDHLAYFRQASEAWATEGVFAELRLIGRTSEGRHELLKASIQIGVDPALPTFILRTDDLVVAKQIVGPLTFTQVGEIRTAAESGRVSVGGMIFSFPEGPVSYYSKVPTDEEWNYILNLTCRSDKRTSQDSLLWSAINAQLRCAEMPFDGIADVCLNLSLPNPASSTEPQIDIYVHAPAELVVSGSTFDEGELRLEFRAFANLELSKISVGLRWSQLAFERTQIASEIQWSPPTGSVKAGSYVGRKEKSDGALVMLSVGGYPVRRQWVIGAHRAATVRLGTLQAFDLGWERLRESLLNNTKDARGFERAVATLAFLLGFQAVPYTDSDAPDLALFTNGGRVALVECTLRTSDVHTKLGKLASRRAAVINQLNRIGTPAPVFCLLVCPLLREQILLNDADLKKASVHLITQENLDNLLLRIRFFPSSDVILDEAISGNTTANG